MRDSRTQKILTYVLLSLFALVMVTPFYYMVITSLKSNDEASVPVIDLLVRHPTTLPYRDLLKGSLFLSSAINSLLIALATTIGSMILCPLAGYAFAKHRFPGRDFIFVSLLATMMIPGTVLLVPGFLLFRDFGWLDTWLPLIVPGLAGVFGVFLSRQFIEKLPDSLIDSAKMDGLPEWGIFARVVMPLSKPLLATLAIFTFLGSWNSFLGPLIILQDEKKFTLPLVIAMLQGRFQGKENVQMAGAVMSILPVLIIFFIFQKQIVESLANTGLKEG
jgi:ABC-type glycerol-3-phosphate transport system permease component